MSDAGIERWVPVEPGFFSPRAHFLLRVHGESMRDAASSMATCWPCTARPWPRVARSSSPGWMTKSPSKRLRLRETIAELLPANSAYAPIRIDLNRQELVIEGRAVGLIRAGDMARNL